MKETENFVFPLWRWAVWGAPVWWVLGLNLGIYHLVSMLLFLAVFHRTLQEEGKIFLPFSGAVLFWFILVYSFSLGIHAFAAEGQRVMASAYNLSFWGIGLLLILVMSNQFSLTHISSFLTVFSNIAWFSGLLAVAMLFVWKLGVDSVVFPTPLYGLTEVIGNTSLVENSLLVNPLLWDWFASASRPRLNIFSPYPTATAAILTIFLMMMLTHALKEKKIRDPFFVVCFGINLLALFMTLSRVAILAFGLSLFINTLLPRKHFLLWTFLFLSLAVLASPELERCMNFLLGLREGSTAGRLELYTYSLQQLHGVDWLLGLGLKPREPSSLFPLGSHSTYFSLLFRTGIVGTALFLVFQGSLFWQWYQLKSLVFEDRNHFLFWRGLGWVFLMMSLWMITEDIDAPQFLAFLYFSVVGVFEGFRRSLLSRPFLP